jgi:hypothetical protein
MALRFLAYYGRNFPDSGFTVSLTLRQKPLQGAFPWDTDIPEKARPHYKGFLYEESDIQLSHHAGVHDPVRVCMCVDGVGGGRGRILLHVLRGRTETGNM